MAMNVAGRVQNWAHRQASSYRDDHERPLGGYLTLIGVYAAGTGAASLLGRALGRTAPTALSPWDVAQLALATQRVARLVAKDPVTSPVRAPVTRYTGTSAPGEVAEEVRGHGLAHAVGELLICPMCVGQWIATAFTLGLVLAPRPTRLAMGTFAGMGVADFLQHLYVRLQQATE